MSTEIKFRKGRIFLGIIIFVILFALSISFLLNAENYLEHFFSNVAPLQTIGGILFIYSSTVLYSLVKIFSRKDAIRITEEYLVDNSKYESLGKIKWRDISKIQRIQKRNIEVFLNPTAYKAEKSNRLKRFLRFMHHWNYSKSMLISSALLDCSREELFEAISEAYEKNKPHTTS